jgi:integrase
MTEGVNNAGLPMALGKITKTVVEMMQPGDWLWDADHREVVKGFGARRQRDGVFYYLRYRLNGRQSIRSIGRHGSPYTPDTARVEAKRLLGQVAAGTDPAAEKEKARKAEGFGAEVEHYLDRKKAGMKPRAFSEVERHLLSHAKPLHRTRLMDIDGRAIALLLAEIETESGPVARNRVRSSLSAFFGWAVREGLLDINPVAGTGKAEEGGSRERVLSDAELVEVCAALGEDQFGDIVRLLILTGQRREEIGGLRWSEVDFGGGAIVLPPQRTKNKREHTVPLSAPAKEILARQPRRKGKDGKPRDLIFGHGGGGFSAWSDCKENLDRRIVKNRDANAKPTTVWRLHDLRRTAATMMADRLGVLPHIVEAILNHVSGHRAGVAGVYNRARYSAEMRDALARWAEYVEGITRR